MAEPTNNSPNIDNLPQLPVENNGNAVEQPQSSLLSSNRVILTPTLSTSTSLSLSTTITEENDNLPPTEMVLNTLERYKKKMRDADYENAMKGLNVLRQKQNKFDEYTVTIYIIEPEFLPPDSMADHFILSAKQVFSDHKFYLTKEGFNEIQLKLHNSREGFLIQGHLIDISQKYQGVEHIRDWMNFMSKNIDCHRRVLDNTRHCDDEHCRDIEHFSVHLDFTMVRFARLCKIRPVN